MRKSLLLTCLLTLVAVFSMAQTKTTFPITLTEAEGLPGPFVVQNYLFQSEVYVMDKPVQKIRLTVCNTNTANDTGRGSNDGVSAYNGTGQPFFTMSEVRFFDENGDAVSFVATGNSVDPGDGGGYAALSDKDETTYLHTNYGGRCESMPAEYHYVEFELEKEVTTFSFTIQTRSRYYKNLITYMGVTGGSVDATEEELQYLPYLEQQFQLGKKVTDVAELATPGALYVMQGTADDYTYDYEYTLSGEPYVVTHTMPGDLYMRSPYEGCITPSAANVFYLVPDADGVEDAYRVCWLNSGRYIAYHTGGNDIWASWTREISEAASLTFESSETSEGNFLLSLEAKGNDNVDCTAYLSYDGYGRMKYIADIDSALYKTDRPNTLEWAIYNASINGAAIMDRLTAEIEEAKARIEAIGGAIEGQDEGEYDALVLAITAAEELAANADATVGEILTMVSELRQFTVAYAAVGLWAYADSIMKIEEMYDNGAFELCEGPNWKVGAYLQTGYDALMDYLMVVDEVTSTCESLTDVDAAIVELYAKIDAFWATKLTKDTNIVTLPYRIGRAEEGLPGVNTNSVFRWESSDIYFTEEIEQIRMTVFKTKSGRNLNGKPFVCLTELEFYDLAGNKIPMTGDCYYSPSVAGEGGGLAGLCDGSTTTGTHFHSQWNADDDYDGSEYFYLDITFPEPVTGFKYVQYARGNGYDDAPTDFAFGYYGEQVIPEEVHFPALEDPYQTKLGEQITDVSQITDDGFYALVGLNNCAPEGSGSGYEKLYSEAKAFGAVYDGASPACAYTITKAGEDTYHLRSVATSKYLKDGASYIYCSYTEDIEKAAPLYIVSTAELREDYGMEPFENAFMIYQIDDTLKSKVTDAPEEYYELYPDSIIPKPYHFLQDYGETSHVYNPKIGFEQFSFQGEFEWYIYKLEMNNPYVYWLSNVHAKAAEVNLVVGTDPGYYTGDSFQPFVDAVAKAQLAIEENNNELAKEALLNLWSVWDLPNTAERNPVVAGNYVIEADDVRYIANQGSQVAICAYFNPFEKYSGELSTSSEYSLWWTRIPFDYTDASAIDKMFQFELIPAVITEDAPEGSIYSEELAIWYEDSVVTEEQLASAFFIKSLKTNQYIGVSELLDDNGVPRRSNNIGFTDEPLYPYIVREQGAYKFDLWCPVGPNNCLHQENHSNGAGQPSHIVQWNGGSGVQASLWQLRNISEITSIDNLVIDAEGEVVSVAYYTVDGAAVAAPVKGINIVKSTYANGVVKTSKVFVK